MKKSKRGVLAAVLMGLGLFACATDPNDPTKLEIKSPINLTLSVGDTSDLWVVSKTFVDGNGRTTTTSQYTFFTLASSDPAVAKVIRNQQLVAIKAGQVKVVASDDKSNLVSDSVTVIIAEP